MYTVHDDYSIQNALRSLGAKHLVKPASRAGLGEAVKGVVKQISTQKLDGPQKILIAEDTETVRQILKQQLARLGIEADFVEDGRQALEALKTGEYGILFTDLHMPDIDGYGVIKSIRTVENEDDRFPVIVMTADVQMAQRQTYMELGFDECLLKPVSLAQVRRLMMRWGLLPEIMPDEDDEKEENAENPQPTQDQGKPIDYTELENMLGALDDTAIEMLDMFETITTPLMDDLAQALIDGNQKKFADLGHSVKGAARSAGAITLGDMCEAIETDGEAVDLDQCQLMLNDAQKAFDDVKAHIQVIKKDGFV